jgi:hypothetical protein
MCPTTKKSKQRVLWRQQAPACSLVQNSCPSQTFYIFQLSILVSQLSLICAKVKILDSKFPLADYDVTL